MEAVPCTTPEEAIASLAWGRQYVEPDDISRRLARDSAAPHCAWCLVHTDAQAMPGDAHVGQAYNVDVWDARDIERDSLAACTDASFVPEQKAGKPTVSRCRPPTMPSDSAGEARRLPRDPMFRLEAWTVEALAAPVSELLEGLISVLAAEEGISIIRVDRAKMCIKGEARRFVFKARIYRAADCSHAVEFRRRSGDSIAATRFFRRIASVLGWPQCKTHLVCPEDLPEMDALHVQGTNMLLQPLLDMAMCGSLLQAEAADGLADAAAEPQLAKSLCTAEGFAALLHLLRHGGYATLSAMAQVLSRVAMEPQAVGFFADERFWQALLDLIVVQGVCDTLHRQFAHVASCALTLSVAVAACDVAERQRQMLQHLMARSAISPLVRDILSAAVVR
eukprot:NODE_8655_length_1478_cov_38.425611.p1 GENE.NODE_8655_length_1478_cov_38.425611~~NODE_8655_length_1478_cov_38.425611.p1  ORF type:complete len:393 (+),score=65.30 NODE_8655_length_1478_cov_38.425611:75-1253(+)